MKLTYSTIIDMKQRILDQISHPYLTQELDTPIIDEDRLFVLLSILHSQNLSKEYIEKYAITVMLIQIALDTHDLVTNDNHTDQKKQQLTVLAGDYYSGLYYQTLAQLSDINLIQVLAEGIKIVNEQKISVYKKEVRTIDEFFTSLSLIDTVIYQKLANFFNDSKWEFVAGSWLHINQIFKKKKQYMKYLVHSNIKINTQSQINELETKRSKRIEDWVNTYIQSVQTQLEDQLAKEPEVRDLLEGKLYIEEKINQPFAL